MTGSLTTTADFHDQALAEIEAVRRWSPRVMSKLEALINAADPWMLYRVDPIRFAAERGIAEQEAIDLFLHAAHIGLFQLEWRLICPSCSATISSCRSMNTLHSRCFCPMCQIDAEVNLDDYIGVAFNLSSRVRDLPWHHPDTLSAKDLLLRYQIDAHAEYEGFGRIADLLERVVIQFIDYLEPGASHTQDLDLPATVAVEGFDILGNTAGMLLVDGPAATHPQALTIALTDAGWGLSTDRLAPGPLRITLANNTTRRVPMALILSPRSGEPPKVVLGNFLRGNQLLNNQTFRTLFRTETLATGEGMGIRDLTLLFTDLKGSTELYERVGDLAAFSLVQQHFEHLHHAVQEQEGAVIKTIGDAVMASFTRPEQAVKSALAMFREIEQFNTRRGDRDLILKIGIHRGSGIAVTLNDRLDYFGQTVNIAARVQGVANSDEVCITQQVMDAPGVAELISELHTSRESAQLKGIAGSMSVYHVGLRVPA